MTSLFFLMAIIGLAFSVLSIRRRRLAGLAPTWQSRTALTVSLMMLAAIGAIYILILNGHAL